MRRVDSKTPGKALQSALTVICMAFALAGSHAMVGQLSLARAAGESSGTPVEELRHETLDQRRESQLTVHVTWRLPDFKFPLTNGRLQALQAWEHYGNSNPLSGGQHALRNGFGAPLLT